VRRHVRRQFLHRHPIDAGTALVLLHPSKRRFDVAAFDDELQQLLVVVSRAHVLVRRPSRFTAPPSSRGFTPTRRRKLRLRGHLVLFAFEAHARFALLAVLPFAPVKGFRGSGVALLGFAVRYYGSADFSLRASTSPFRREARSPQVRTLSFTARAPGLRRLSLGHRGFAVSCPLAPLADASYPVSVGRSAASLPASFPRSVALWQLRFTSIG
jgi:hypothetical protein